MIKSPKKSLRLKNKRLLSELELTGLADNESSVSAEFNMNKLLLFLKKVTFKCFKFKKVVRIQLIV